MCSLTQYCNGGMTFCSPVTGLLQKTVLPPGMTQLKTLHVHHKPTLWDWLIEPVASQWLSQE
jgi:hypothetical protein